MAYIALRFIDLFRPGDSIPAGHYPSEAMAKMIASGKVERVDEPQTVVPDKPVLLDATGAAESQAAAPRRKAKRKSA